MIDQLVYIQISKIFENFTNKGMICKLLIALHGQKQVLKLWYKRLSQLLLKKLGLKQINTDYSIFVTKKLINGLIISTFIDDIKVMGIKKLS